jgi:hypothetical protein
MSNSGHNPFGGQPGSFQPQFGQQPPAGTPQQGYPPQPQGYGQQPGYPPPPPAGGSGGRTALGCMLGCVGVLVVTALVCVLGVWWVASNAKRIAADAVRDALVQTVQDSEMSDEDKTEVIAQIDRVNDAYKEGRIDLEKVAQVMQNLGESPLFALAMVYGAEKQYVEPSGLTDQEKTDARRTLQRAARGVFEKKISQFEIDKAIDRISTPGPNGQKQLKERLTDDELKAFLKDLKTLADDANVPDEPFEVDIGEEFKKAVDKALGSEA